PAQLSVSAAAAPGSAADPVTATALPSSSAPDTEPIAGVGATLATLIVVSALAAPPSPSAAVSTTRYVPLSSGVNWKEEPAPEANTAAPPFLYTAQLSVRVSCTPGSAADPAT